jgi:alpha-mannosidase
MPSQFNTGHIYAYVLENNFRTNFSPAQNGEMLFRYSLTSHKGDWKTGEARDFGWAATNPLIPVLIEEKNSTGTLGKKMSFAQVDKPNVLLLALKRAESTDDLILRLIETEGQEVEVTVTLPFCSIQKSYLTNLVEENTKEIGFGEHKIIVPVKAFGIITVRLQTQ